MSKTRLFLSAAVSALLLSSPAALAQTTTDKAKTEYNRAKEEMTEKRVNLSQVPAPAMAAARQQIGTNIKEAKQATENGQTVYEIEGRDASNKERSVHVTADGKVLRTR